MERAEFRRLATSGNIVVGSRMSFAAFQTIWRNSFLLGIAFYCGTSSLQHHSNEKRRPTHPRGVSTVKSNSMLGLVILRLVIHKVVSYTCCIFPSPPHPGRHLLHLPGFFPFSLHLPFLGSVPWNAPYPQNWLYGSGCHGPFLSSCSGDWRFCPCECALVKDLHCYENPIYVFP